MATHSSILSWRIPWTEEPSRPQSIVLQRVGHDWSDLADVRTGSQRRGGSASQPGTLLGNKGGTSRDKKEASPVLLYQGLSDQQRMGNISILLHEWLRAKSLQSCPTTCDPTDYSPPAYKKIKKINNKKIKNHQLVFYLNSVRPWVKIYIYNSK